MTKRLLKTKRDMRRAIAVNSANIKALTLAPAAGALTGATRNVAYAGAVTFALNTPVGAASYSLATGALPVGMSINAKTGVLSGTPTSPAGAFAFSVRGTDAFGNTKVNAYTLALAA